MTTPMSTPPRFVLAALFLLSSALSAAPPAVTPRHYDLLLVPGLEGGKVGPVYIQLEPSVNERTQGYIPHGEGRARHVIVVFEVCVQHGDYADCGADGGVDFLGISVLRSGTYQAD